MRPRLLVLILLATPLLAGFTWPGALEWLCTRGVRQYRSDRFEDAAESFTRALRIDPDNATLQYNRGTALYQAGQLDGAEEAFARATEGSDDTLTRDAQYNLGNTRFRAGNYHGAIAAYKDALRLDPTDMAAKHNLELAQRKLKEQQQQQQQQQRQEQQQQQEQQEQQQEQRRQEQREQEEQRQGQEQQHQRQQQQQQQEQQEAEQGAARMEEGQLSPDQARRLLRALAAEDARLQQIIRRAPRRRAPVEGERDW
ncbi:MAG: tetratricopeptide repeat protein [Armatimonadota bacterium]